MLLKIITIKLHNFSFYISLSTELSKYLLVKNNSGITLILLLFYLRNKRSKRHLLGLVFNELLVFMQKILHLNTFYWI